MTVQEVSAKIQNMTAKEIIMSMVTGLRKRHTEINMDTYGTISNGICYGCAATNCIIELAEGEKDWLFPSEIRITAAIPPIEDSNRKVIELLFHFESAINFLRQGEIELYNQYEELISIPKIHVPVDFFAFFPEIPFLEDDYTEEDLLVYEQLANAQPEW